MRVTVISHTYVVGLNRRKWEWLAREQPVTLQLIVPESWTEGELRRRLRAEPAGDAPYRLETIPQRGGHPALRWFALARLQRAVRAFSPHLMHVEEEPWTLAALQATLAARAARCPMTLFTWENLNRRLPPPLGTIQRIVLGRTAWAIAGNRDAARVLRERGFHGPCAVIPQLGVDPDLFRPDGRRPTDGGPVVGFVGRLVEAKGVRVLLEAFERLPEDYRLLVVGDGPLREAVRALVGRADGRVEWHGSVPHAEVASWLRRMDILALPSLTTPGWKEQFGHVLIEAMASGVAVVGSDSGAIPEVIGDAGRVVPEGDAAALAAALLELGDADERAALAARARRRVLDEFTDRQIARRLWDVLRAAADGRTEPDRAAERAARVGSAS